jgi:hypothetical protein
MTAGREYRTCWGRLVESDPSSTRLAPSVRRDRNVIVSNQFATVPAPGRDARGACADGRRLCLAAGRLC